MASAGPKTKAGREKVPSTEPDQATSAPSAADHDANRPTVPPVLVYGGILCLAWIVYRVINPPMPVLHSLPEIPVPRPKYTHYESPDRNPTVVRNMGLRAVKPDEPAPVPIADAEPCMFDSTAQFFPEYEEVRQKRIVLENVLETEECELLIKLSDRLVKMGFAYQDDPLFQEKFAAADLIDVYRGASSTEKQQIVEIRERVRSSVERHFKPALTPSQRVLLELTHITRRNPLPQSHPSHFNNSHEIHADNCMIFPNGSCIPMEESCCAWRSHSSILYLNGQTGLPEPHYTGGQLFFLDNTTNGERKRRVVPKCGRLVAFSSGAENLHGVRNVVQGLRYVMAMWYTLDPVEAWESHQYPELSVPELRDLSALVKAGSDDNKSVEVRVKPPPADRHKTGPAEPAAAAVASEPKVFQYDPAQDAEEPLQFVAGFRTFWTENRPDAVACPSCHCDEQSLWGGTSREQSTTCLCPPGTSAHVIGFSKTASTDGASFLFETAVGCA